ncbi:hypothetical protein KY290_033568 [Solanum tuberosum]|uniref:Uncharacterized protein n=1 Tax=Solanum tuberosum TaxID=4113 RepID=A0ABQ7U4B1_SOLTU|nr:hypothetical protein KY289_032935 [Solanum tuberosum]KAH0644638.1 hypothetical protein KY284_032522 [Solanum tuberosum]KAH0647576.1 hypothetical protein KY285_032824 [Solanum tuberosum]KAH0740525.1 hypothetical protein KY290_033568 [Solanum tuberosum]
MIKFEYDRQEVIIHGEGDLSIYKDSSLHFIKVNNETEALVYQAFEVVAVEHIPEGNLISKPQFPMASVRMVNEMLKHGFEPGYNPTIEDKMKAKKHKRKLTLPKQVLEASEELIDYFQNLFVEADMVEIGEGSSNREVQFNGPDVQLNNWEVIPLLIKKES